MVFGLKKTIAHIAGNMSLSTPSNGDSYLGNAIGEDHRPRSPPFFPAYDQGTRNEPYKRHPYDATEIDNSPLKDTRHRYEIHTPDTSPPRDIRPPTQELDVGNRGSRPSTRETDRGSRPSTGEADRNRRHSTTHTQETHSNRKTTHPAYIWDYEDNGHGDPRDKQIKDLEARIKKMDSLVAKAKDDQDQLSIVRNERDSLRKRVLSYDTRYNKVTKERDDLQKKVDSLSRVTKERDDLQKRVETFKGVIKERDDFRGRCDAFGIKFAKACSERDDWQKKYNGKIAKAVTERTEAYREKCNAMLRERNAAHNQEIAHLKKEKEEMQKHAETYYKRFTDLEGKQGDLVKNYDEMQALVEKQKVNINELTVSISRSVNTSGTTTRDDDYFEREFASLAGAIHQWVIRYFRGISVVKHQELPQDILEFLGIGVPGYKMLPGSALNIKQIEAAFADRLCSNVFVPAFLFTIQGKLYDFGDFCGPLAGTDLKKREWYAQTVGMFFANEKYDGHLNHNARCVEKDLQEFSGFLAKGENEEQRHTTLPEIIEQAVKLQRETFQQVSLFQLHKIMPGDPYDPIIMEDVSGVVDDEDEDEDDEDDDEDEEIMDKDEADGKEKRKEKGTRSFVVRTTIFAPVFRWGFDDDGMFSKTPVVVRKGAVIAIRAVS